MTLGIAYPQVVKVVVSVVVSSRAQRHDVALCEVTDVRMNVGAIARAGADGVKCVVASSNRLDHFECGPDLAMQVQVRRRCRLQ